MFEAQSPGGGWVILDAILAVVVAAELAVRRVPKAGALVASGRRSREGAARSGGGRLDVAGAVLFFGGILGAALPGRPAPGWLAASFGAIALGVALPVIARVRARRARRPLPPP